MGEPILTMVRANDVARGPCDAPECARVAGRLRSNPLLDERPRRFDGIQVVRVRRQISDGGAALFNEQAHGELLVCLEIVEHDDVAWAQARLQSAAHPRRERCRCSRRATSSTASPSRPAEGHRSTSSCRPSSSAALPHIRCRAGPMRAIGPSQCWRRLHR